MERSLRLVIFGLTISSSWGNGHATLWRGLCKALARAGHEVSFYERDVDYYASNRDLSELPGGRLVLYREWDEAAASAACELREADAAIVSSYCPDGVAATELVLASPVPLRAFYDLDTPVTLARLSAGEPVAYIGPRGLRDFDLVLSYTGGEALEQLRTRLGARRAVAALRQRRSRAASAARRRSSITGPTSPISAPSRRTGRRCWRSCSSSPHGAGRSSAS